MKSNLSLRITTIPLLKSVVVFAFIFLLFYPDQTFAQVRISPGDFAGTGLLTQDLRVLLGNIIQAVLGLMGIVAVGVIIYGGVKYQLARGDEQLIAEAKSIITNGGVGLAIVIGAYAIVTFIIGAVVGNIGTPSTPEDDSFFNRNDINQTGFGALGGGIIDMVAPAPFTSDVPRNTSIQIKFKEAIDIKSLINDELPSSDWLTLNCPSNTQPISCGYYGTSFSMRTDDGLNTPIEKEDIVVTTYDYKTFTFKRARRTAESPPFLFGNSKFPTPYKVILSDILLKNGRTGLRGTFSWNFSVGTTIDAIPPRVVGIIPNQNQEDVPRNSLVQITFSEPISLEGVLIPVRVSEGTFGPLNDNLPKNETLKITSTTSSNLIFHVAGDWSISNEFKTLTFQPLAPCAEQGQSSILTSCGVPALCLPSNTQLNVLITSFREVTGIGIRDMADNALDGNPEIPAGAPPRNPAEFENFSWQFLVGSTLDLVPPFICNIPGSESIPECSAGANLPPFGSSPIPAYPGSPIATGETVAPRTIPSMRFSEELDLSSVNTTSIYVSRWEMADKACAKETGTGQMGQANTRPDEECFNPFGVFSDGSSRLISMRFYGNNQSPSRPSLDPNQDYAVRVTNQVRDARQNCFNPTIIKPSN